VTTIDHRPQDLADADDFSRLDPCDITAEQWCLGGMMANPAAIADVAEMLSPDDFYRPAHEMIYVAIIKLWAQQVTADPINLKAELEQTGELGRCGGPMYLFSLYETGRLISDVGVKGRRIRDLAARRKVLAIFRRGCQRAAEPSADLAELVTGAQADMATAVMEAGANAAHGRGLVDIDTFSDGMQGRQEPVIDGLMDHQDRVVLVGLEGDGKSVLGWQVGFAAAAGLHPFVPGWHGKPQRVLLVDLETPAYLVNERLGRMRDWVQAKAPGWNPANVKLFHEPGGIDLTSASDAMRLADTIRLAAPDLIVAGPVYKMLVDRGQGAEQLHSQVAAFWDLMRARYRSALWLETHAPGPAVGRPRDLRPYGWSGWMRWPEFGRTLERGAKGKGEWRLGYFRGDRQEGRMWPETLTRSKQGRECAPWEARYPAGTFQSKLDDDSEWEAS